jgi:hypothetical protein
MAPTRWLLAACYPTVCALQDGHRAAHQRLGLWQPIGALLRLCEVVEVDGAIGMSAYQD